jgi:serine/threonine protein kinase/WD40 repeat protein
MGVDKEPADADVGRKAVELGLITAAQLADALLQLTEQPAPAKKPTSLSAALISGGLLTQRQVDVLVEGNTAPTQVGKYRIVRELGRGGMGVVYEAEDQELSRRVALKMLLGSFHADPQETALEEERFIRESRLSANLPKHPHLVGVYEAGSSGGRRFIAMEFIEGKQFSDWRAKGSVTIRHQVTVLRDVAMAIEHAHKHGVIHRDLKPQNILVDSRNQPHVTDFGLAKGSSRKATLSLTASGLVMGTPAYMAPEQAEGKKDVDKRADIWALGVMLYEILTGRLPFIGQTPIEILMKTVNDPVPLPSSFFPRGAHATLDRTIENVCLKALAKQPKDRYPSAKAFADDLSGWLKGRKVEVAAPRKKVPSSWIIGGAVAAAVLVAAIAFAALSDSPSDRAARAEEYNLQGRRHLVNRRYSDAIFAFGRALEEDPDNRQAKAGKKEAEEKLVAMGRNDKPTPQPPPSQPPVQPPVQPPTKPPPPPPPPSEDAARKARDLAAELQRKELGEVDAAIRPLVAGESFGTARNFLQQAVQRHEQADWKAAIASRQDELKKTLEFHFGTVKEQASKAKRAGDLTLVDVLRARVGRWDWPDAPAELEEFLSKVAMPTEPPPASVGPLEPLRCHTSGIHVLALAPDGKSLLTGSFDKSVRFWDLETRKERRMLFNDFPVMGSISPDGRWIGVGFVDGTLRVWDTATLQFRIFPGHKSQVTGIVFSPDGRSACSTSTDGVARFWDVASATIKEEVGGFPLGAMSLAMSPDGKMVAVGAAERLVRILDMPSGTERKLFENVHQSVVYYVAFSPDGKQLLTAGKDQVVTMIDIASGKRRNLVKLTLPGTTQIRQVAFTPDGRYAAVASSDGNIGFFDAVTAAPVKTVTHKNSGFYSMVFTRKGDVMLTGMQEAFVQFWDMKSLGLYK